jgi:glucan phosphorylase
VQGVDIWLNTPTRPLEASGTSGMKAVMNGVMNFSVLDGWWVEGYRENAGWALDQERTFDNQSYQDELDVETIYNKLEFEIAPMFYERNEERCSREMGRDG